MTYSDFYDIAEYQNETQRAKFTPKEIAENAYEFLCELEESMQKPKVTHVIQELLELLDEDGNEIALEYVNMILYDLGLCVVEK